MTEDDKRIEYYQEEKETDAATGMTIRSRVVSFKALGTNWEYETEILDEMVAKAKRIMGRP